MKKMKIGGQLLFVIILIFNCTTKDNKIGFIQNENRLDYSQKYSLIDSYAVIFPLDSSSTFVQFSSQINKSISDSLYYYSHLNSNDYSVTYYDLLTKKRRKIYLKKEGENGIGNLGGTSAHSFIGPDKVYIYNSMNGHLFDVDSMGIIRAKYQIVDYEGKSDIAFPEPSSYNPFVVKDDYVYFPCIPGRSRMNYDNYGVVLKYNLQQRKTEYILPLPHVYSSAFWGSSFKYLTNFDIAKDNKLVVGHPISQEVLITDLEGGILKTNYIASKYFEKIEPMHKDLNYALGKKRDWNREKLFSLSNSENARIAYDKYRDLYHRICFIRPSLEEVKKGNKKPDFSILTMDSNLVKLGETKFSGNKYHVGSFAITEEGIWLSRVDLYKKNENEINFSVFKITENR